MAVQPAKIHDCCLKFLYIGSDQCHCRRETDTTDVNVPADFPRPPEATIPSHLVNMSLQFFYYWLIGNGFNSKTPVLNQFKGMCQKHISF
jgi:hypothetical protein